MVTARWKCDRAYCRNQATWRVFIIHSCDKHLAEYIRIHFSKGAALRAEAATVQQIEE